MDEETTLADLLDLNLHNYEDDVHNIVDKAIKEMAKDLDVNPQLALDGMKNQSTY